MVDFDPDPNIDTEYEEYELSKEERASLRSIQEVADKGYDELSLLRSHINFLEKLLARTQEIVRNEQAMGYQNDTLIHDFQKMKVLAQRLDNELNRLDQSF